MLNSFAKCLEVELEQDQMLLVDMNHVILSKKKKIYCTVPSWVPSPVSAELQTLWQGEPVTNTTQF